MPGDLHDNCRSDTFGNYVKIKRLFNKYFKDRFRISLEICSRNTLIKKGISKIVRRFAEIKKGWVNVLF